MFKFRSLLYHNAPWVASAKSRSLIKTEDRKIHCRFTGLLEIRITFT